MFWLWFSMQIQNMKNKENKFYFYLTICNKMKKRLNEVKKMKQRKWNKQKNKQTNKERKKKSKKLSKRCLLRKARCIKTQNPYLLCLNIFHIFNCWWSKTNMDKVCNFYSHLDNQLVRLDLACIFLPHPIQYLFFNEPSQFPLLFINKQTKQVQCLTNTSLN